MPGEAVDRRFKETFDLGEQHYSKADYAAAITLFREADRLKVTPEVAYDLARSYEKLGDVASTLLFDRLYLSRAPGASDATTVLARVERALGKAQDDGRTLIEVYAPAATSIVIADQRFPNAPIALFLPPGEYAVEATFPTGNRRSKIQVVLGRPQTTWLEPLPPPLIVASEPSLDAARVTAERPNLARTSAFAVFGASVVALGTGLVFGILANADALASQDKERTVREALQLAQGSNQKATVANVLFASAASVFLISAGLFVFSLPEPGIKVTP
jgi:hypothetical protein